MPSNTNANVLLYLHIPFITLGLLKTDNDNNIIIKLTIKDNGHSKKVRATITITIRSYNNISATSGQGNG